MKFFSRIGNGFKNAGWAIAHPIKAARGETRETAQQAKQEREQRRANRRNRTDSTNLSLRDYTPANNWNDSADDWNDSDWTNTDNDGWTTTSTAENDSDWNTTSESDSDAEWTTTSNDKDDEWQTDDNNDGEWQTDDKPTYRVGRSGMVDPDSVRATPEEQEKLVNEVYGDTSAGAQPTQHDAAEKTIGRIMTKDYGSAQVDEYTSKLTSTLQQLDALGEFIDHPAGKRDKEGKLIMLNATDALLMGIDPGVVWDVYSVYFDVNSPVLPYHAMIS